MKLRDKVDKVFGYLEKNEKKTCGQYFCGTCGGRVRAIRDLLDEDENIRSEILEIFEAAEDLDMDSVQTIYKWVQLFGVGLPFYLGFSSDQSSLIVKKMYIIIDHVTPLLEEQIKKEIAQKNIREIDKFLFHKRDIYHNCTRDAKSCRFIEFYDSVLKAGMDLVLKTRDYSLVETILVVLGDQARKFPEYFNLALNILPKKTLKRCLTHYKV